MSVQPSPEPSGSLSEDIPHCSVDLRPRLHIRLATEPSKIAEVSSEVIRLAERFMPGIPHFLSIDGDSMVLCVQHGTFRVWQTDMLACRLARIHGIFHVNAEQKTAVDGVIYRALLQGRSRAGCFDK